MFCRTQSVFQNVEKTSLHLKIYSFHKNVEIYWKVHNVVEITWLFWKKSSKVVSFLRLELWNWTEPPPPPELISTSAPTELHCQKLFKIDIRFPKINVIRLNTTYQISIILNVIVLQKQCVALPELYSTFLGNSRCPEYLSGHGWFLSSDLHEILSSPSFCIFSSALLEGLARKAATCS